MEFNVVQVLWSVFNYFLLFLSASFMIYIAVLAVKALKKYLWNENKKG